MQQTLPREEPQIPSLSAFFPESSEEELRTLDEALSRYVSIALRVFDDLEAQRALTEDESGRTMESQRSNITRNSSNDRP